MSYLDDIAKIAAWEALAEAAKIFDALPNLSTTELEAVLGAKLTQAYKDHLSNYNPAEAHAALRSAAAEVSKEFSGLVEHGGDDFADDEPGDFGLSPRAAARLLAERRRS